MKYVLLIVVIPGGQIYVAAELLYKAAMGVRKMLLDKGVRK